MVKKAYSHVQLFSTEWRCSIFGKFDYRLEPIKYKLKFDHYQPFHHHSYAKYNDKPMPVLLCIYFGKLKTLNSLRVG